MPGFDFLAVPGQAIPNTHDDWMGLDMNDWNAVFARFTDHYLIVVAQSVLFQAVPSAFGARQVHGSMCASAHIVESLLLQFATATPPAQSFLFADTALSPGALSRIEAHVVALPGFVMPTSDDAHELVRRLAGLHANLSAEDLVTLGADDFIALEPIGQSHISANASWALQVSLYDHQCLCSIQSLSVMGDVAALLGPRAVEHARATPHRQLSRVAVALHAGALEAGDVTVAPDLVLQSIWASQWPPILKTSILSPIAAQNDARSRYKYAAGTPDSMTRALSTRLCEVVPAFVTLGEVAMPAHSPAELAARLRSLLTAVDACARFKSVISLESLTALDHELHRLGHSRSDGDTPAARIACVVARRQERADHLDSTPVSSSTGGSSSSGSKVPSCFRREHGTWLNHEIHTNKKISGPLVRYDRRPGDSGDPPIDEVNSGLTALFAVPAIASDHIRVLHIAFASRLQLVFQILLFEVPNYPQTDLFTTLVKAKPYIGHYLSIMVITPDSGKVSAEHAEWKIGYDVKKKAEDNVAIAKPWMEHLRSGAWHLLDFHNDLHVSFDEFRKTTMASSRLKFGGNLSHQWTTLATPFVIGEAERFFSAIGYPRGASSGFAALANDAYNHHRDAPCTSPMAHAETAQVVCSFGLADAGTLFEQWLTGPASSSGFPSFDSDNERSRARTRLSNRQEGAKTMFSINASYPELFNAAAAAPPPAIGGGVGAGGGKPPPPKKPKVVPPPKPPPPPNAPLVQGPRPPGSMARLVTVDAQNVNVKWEPSKGDPQGRIDKIPKAKLAQGRPQPCNHANVCWGFQVVHALMTRGDPEFRKENALAWCTDCAAHGDKTAAIHQPWPELTRALVQSFRLP